MGDCLKIFRRVETRPTWNTFVASGFNPMGIDMRLFGGLKATLRETSLLFIWGLVGVLTVIVNDECK